jgi:hypothetical protein
MEDYTLKQSLAIPAPTKQQKNVNLELGDAGKAVCHDILIGIRKTARDDGDALEKGMQVFEMLYVSKR